MSLIHDALKKAEQKERAKIGSGIASMEEAAESAGKEIPKRTIVLVVILALALALFAYMRFKPKGDETSVKPVPQAAVVEGAGTQDVGLLKKRAITAYKSNDLDTAYSNLSSALKLNNIDPEIWNNMGVVEKSRGDTDKARQSYLKALEFKPDYPEALGNLAVIEMDEGNNTQALEHLEKALKISPAYPEANFHLALLYDKKGDKKKAADYYKRFLEVGGDFPSSVIDSVRDHLMEIEQ